VREPRDELRREYCGLLSRVTTSFRFHEFADVARHSSEAVAKKHPYNAGPWITGIEKRSTWTKNALIRPYAECRIMPSVAGERQRGGHRVLGVLGIIRGPTRTPEGRHLA
jgi:hypothetical protein